MSWDSGGFAVLEDDLQSGQAWLEQASVIPALMQSLSFSYTLTLTPDGTSGGPQDFFTASLLDSDGNPLLATPGFTDYFYHDSGGFIDYDSSIVTLVGNTVMLDVSSLSAGTDARIVFDLFLSDDGWTTRVEIDNVEAYVIPEPFSMLVWFGVFGAGANALGFAKRRRRVSS